MWIQSPLSRSDSLSTQATGLPGQWYSSPSEVMLNEYPTHMPLEPMVQGSSKVTLSISSATVALFVVMSGTLTLFSILSSVESHPDTASIAPVPTGRSTVKPVTFAPTYTGSSIFMATSYFSFLSKP